MTDVDSATQITSSDQTRSPVAADPVQPAQQPVPNVQVDSSPPKAISPTIMQTIATRLHSPSPTLRPSSSPPSSTTKPTTLPNNSSTLHSPAANPVPAPQSPPVAPETATEPPDAQPDQSPKQNKQISPKPPPPPPIPVPRKTNTTPPQRNNNNRKPARPSHPDRSLPNNLPKVARNRPENARVFIGNLASEYTDVAEIVSVFYKYGQLIEEPVLRRSFGFVQYSTAEAANLAVAAEQGRIIGGIAIDLSIADNREVKRGTHIANNTPFSHAPKIPQHKRGRDRDNNPQSAPRKRRRSLSPASAARKGGVHPPQYRRQRPEPKAGIYLRILCMSPTAKSYARHCENTFRSMTGLKADVLHIVAAGLGEALGRAMRDVIPYVMVVASKDVEDGTCTIRTLEKTGYEKSGRGNGVIPLREAVEVCLIERGVIAPQDMNPGSHHPSTSLQRMPINVNQNPRSNMPGPMMGGAAQWMSHAPPPHAPPMPTSAMDTAKPGWMNAPRPPHPSNPRIAGPNVQSSMQPMPAMVNAAATPYTYNGMDSARHPYGQPARPDHDYGRGAMPPAYDAGPPMPPPPQNIGPDYMRNAPPAPYPPPNMNAESAYPDRYGPPGSNPRPTNSYGAPADTRESEYDPVTVMPASRGQPGGYNGASTNTWNRDNRGYGNPQSLHGGAREREDSYAQIGSNAPLYAGGGPPGNEYGMERQPPYGNMNQGAQPPGYETANAPYGNGQYAPYSAQAPPVYGRPDGANPPVGGNMSGSEIGARYGEGYNREEQQRYGNSGNAMYGAGRSGNQGGWNEERGRPGGHIVDGPRHSSSLYASGGSQPNRAYAQQTNSGGGSHNYSPRNERGSGPVATSSAGTQGGGPGTVDIGKLTNLISAFKQQQSSQAQQQQSQRGRNDGPRNATSGARSHMLAVPAVQQALQNIGGRSVGAPSGNYGMRQAHASHVEQSQHQQGYQSGMAQQNYYR